MHRHSHIFQKAAQGATKSGVKPGQCLLWRSCAMSWHGESHLAESPGFLSHLLKYMQPAPQYESTLLR